MLWLVRVLDGLTLLSGITALGHWYRSGTPMLSKVGVTKQGVLSESGAGLAIGALSIVGIFATTKGLNLIHIKDITLANGGAVATLVELTGAAFLEEIFYRGLMLNGLLILLPKEKSWLSVVVSAAIFGISHAANPHASTYSTLLTTLGGGMYGVAFLRTQRIWFPFGLHLGWNLAQALLGFPVSGFRFPGLVELGMAEMGKDLTGGSYGPEGGLVGVGWRLIEIVLVLWWLWRYKQETSDLQPHIG